MPRNVCLLLLWVSHLMMLGVLTAPGSEILPLKGFDLSKFSGVWYEVALVSTCPHYMQRRRASPAGVAMEMKPSASQNISVTTSTFRNSSCQKTLTQYRVTDRPGRFFYHAARVDADVELNVVQTDYDEFAVMVLLSRERAAGTRTTILKLYGRSVNVTSEVFSKFTTLVQNHGISDSVISTENNGC